MENPNIPLISVCIPTFNCAQYLSQAIASVLMQNYQNIEIVIVDNCSTDETVALVEGVIKNSNRVIRFYKNDQNIGLVGNLNRCLEYSRGEYIKFLMADDMLQPSCLERMSNWLDERKSVSLVACGRLIIDEDGRENSIKRYSKVDCVVPGNQAISECLYGSNFIGEPTAVMFRKSDLEGVFREDMPQVLDIDMWFRLLERGWLAYIGDPLCSIRQHAGQMTNANIKSGALVEDNIKLFDIYSQKVYIKPSCYLTALHRVYMTYRVWMSRQYIPSEKSKMILNRYGCSLLYWAMPAGVFLLRLGRWFLRFLRGGHVKAKQAPWVN
jgi:glycosyltransferase involved in cell wall biosynthesis